MTKFYVFSNLRAKEMIEAAGYRCVMLESQEERLKRTVALQIRRENDIEIISGFVNALSRTYCVYLIFMPQERKGCELVSNPDGRYLTGRETEFIRHVLNDDVVKKTCIEMGLSRSGYYKMLKKILGRLNLKTAEQLHSWALLHLSV